MDITAPVPRPASENTFVNLSTGGGSHHHRKGVSDPFSNGEKSLRASPVLMDPNYYMHDRTPRGSYDPMLMSSPAPFDHSHYKPKTLNGNPTVLGLWAFATVTSFKAAFNLFLPEGSNHIIFPTALLFGGIAQFFAGLLEFVAGGTYPAVLFISYGALWIGNGLMMHPHTSAVLSVYSEDAELAQAQAIYHYIWAIYTAFHVALSFKIKGGNCVNSWNLTFVFLTLFLEGIFYTTSNITVLRVSGFTAFMAAIGAYYGGLVDILKEQGVSLNTFKFKWVPQD
ncbi:GPR1/FUN34/yaaH family-domain-containing protein [Dichotomocladium elegans]|nr:GPR1/FUN34/yaaH family-domain-containing protein [Dichotomocladium elegans]